MRDKRHIETKRENKIKKSIKKDNRPIKSFVSYMDKNHSHLNNIKNSIENNLIKNFSLTNCSTKDEYRNFIDSLPIDEQIHKFHRPYKNCNPNILINDEATITSTSRQNLGNTSKQNTIENNVTKTISSSSLFVGNQQSYVPLQGIIPLPPSQLFSLFSLPLIPIKPNTPNTNINNNFTSNIIPEVTEIIKKNIDVEISNLNELIQMIENNPIVENIQYNINMKSLHAIKPHLIELNSMIGMTKLKDALLDQIIYFAQDLHKFNKQPEQMDFMHTVIYGPPGTGKTEIAKILGKIFSKLGILQKGTFRKATRSDLVAGFLGQTAIKTKELITSCLGGVLFIDEAYSLGNPEGKDSFSKECIDTLCECLSDNKDKLMVIIAGYKDELDTCFFGYNQGLNSRFTWRFETDKYKADELMQIFMKKVIECGWSFHDKEDKKIEIKWFEEHINYFKYYGRDMETLFAKTKIAHSRRVFCKPPEEKTRLTISDVEKGFSLFLENDEVKKRKDEREINKIIQYSMFT